VNNKEMGMNMVTTKVKIFCCTVECALKKTGKKEEQSGRQARGEEKRSVSGWES
jgi:hypothetical protein